VLTGIQNYLYPRMEGKKDNIFRISAVKVFSVGLMFFCLTFFTSINYFLYPDQEYTVNTDTYDQTTGNNFDAGKNTNNSKNAIPPSGPTEEKSSSSGVSILEEFLNDPHPVINFSIGNPVAQHGLADSGKILLYHGELLYPPPEL
jgi:hypothetical protein